MEKVSAENKTFDFFTEKRHNLNDRKTPHKIFDCQGCLSCKWEEALAVFQQKIQTKKYTFLCLIVAGVQI